MLGRAVEAAKRHDGKGEVQCTAYDALLGEYLQDVVEGIVGHVGILRKRGHVVAVGEKRCQLPAIFACERAKSRPERRRFGNDACGLPPNDDAPHGRPCLQKEQSYGRNCCSSNEECGVLPFHFIAECPCRCRCHGNHCASALRDGNHEASSHCHGSAQPWQCGTPWLVPVGIVCIVHDAYSYGHARGDVCRVRPGVEHAAGSHEQAVMARAAIIMSVAMTCSLSPTVMRMAIATKVPAMAMACMYGRASGQGDAVVVSRVVDMMLASMQRQAA